MSDVWNTLIEIQHLLEDHFISTGSEIQEPGMERFNRPGWVNRVWTSNRYRRAHIDVIDARETKGLWMMHCCIFPHIHNPAPIYGFDVIAGRNKITGCFHDFSPAGDPKHPLIHWFADQVKDLNWKRSRDLPDWAERIFTPYIITASNVKEKEELEQIFDIANRSVAYYLDNVAETNNTVENTTEAQNYYAYNQKLNPHNPRVMTNLGLDEEEVRIFVQDCLFPDLR